MQFLHVVNGLADDRSRGGLKKGTETGEHGGIEPIGLGELAGRLGEAPGLAWVDLGHWQAGHGEAAFEGPVIGAGRLEDHPLDPARREPGDEGAMAPGVIGEAFDGVAGIEADVEVVFRDVDTDGKCCRMIHLFPSPLLVIRAAMPGYPFRPRGKREGWSHWQTTRDGQLGHDPSPPAAGEHDSLAAIHHDEIEGNVIRQAGCRLSPA